MNQLPEGTHVINLNSPNAVDELKSAIGLSDGDVLEIMTPQFNRVDNLHVAIPNKDEKFFNNLKMLSAVQLKELGFPPVYASVIASAPEYQECSQWISVEERLPEVHTTVLVVTNFGDIYTCRLPVIVAKNLALDLENGIRERFTHWMPLPPAPEGGE